MSYDEFEARQDTIQSRVRDLLEQDPDTRENDNVLILAYWEEYENLLQHIPRSKLRQLTPAESITRARRKAMESNPRLAPTPQTRRARDVQLRRMSNYYGRRREDEEYRRLMI